MSFRRFSTTTRSRCWTRLHSEESSLSLSSTSLIRFPFRDKGGPASSFRTRISYFFSSFFWKKAQMLRVRRACLQPATLRPSWGTCTKQPCCSGTSCSETPSNSKKKERCDDIPTVSCVIDCTVVEIMGPDLPFNQKDEYYSGKHKRHCLKRSHGRF